MDAAPELIKRELNELGGRLTQILKAAATRKCFSCLYRNPPEYIENITFMGSNKLDSLVTDDEEIFHVFEDYIEKKQPGTIDLTLHTDTECPLTAIYNLNKEVEGA